MFQKLRGCDWLEQSGGVGGEVRHVCRDAADEFSQAFQRRDTE